MSPLQAIKKYCLWCCCNQPQEVRLCPAETCPLWERRLGKGFRGGNLKAIRDRCLDCVGFHPSDVESCDGKITGMDCPLHPYRFGHSPALEGKGRGHVFTDEDRAKARMALESDLVSSSLEFDDSDYEDEEIFNEND